MKISPQGVQTRSTVEKDNSVTSVRSVAKFRGGTFFVSAKDFLQKLSEAHGVSGYEHAIREMVIEEFKPYADEITITPWAT